MSKPIDTLLQQDMSRKDFIITLGLGVASIFGFSTIVHLLTGKSLSRSSSQSHGYGSSSYGN